MNANYYRRGAAKVMLARDLEEAARASVAPSKLRAAKGEGAAAAAPATGSSSVTAAAAAARARAAPVLQRIKGTVLDAMARALPQTDRSFLAQRWGLVSREEAQESASIEALQAAALARIEARDAAMAAMDQAAVEAKVMAEVALAQARLEGKYEAQQEASEMAKAQLHAEAEARQARTHPLLGQLVHEAGYKKVFCTSVEKLVQVPVWEKQRILRPERAAAIAKDKMARENKGMPGVITLFHRRDEFGIVDGQHRIGALMIMCDANAWDRKENNVMVDVFPARTDQDIADLFTEINKAEPVRMVDMPGEGADEHIKAILQEATDELQALFPEMFKPSARCRPPHVNADVFRDDVFQSDLIQRHGLKTTWQLLQWLRQTNEALGERMGAGTGEVTDKALQKAQANKFYLGLDKSWLRQ